MFHAVEKLDFMLSHAVSCHPLWVMPCVSFFVECHNMLRVLLQFKRKTRHKRIAIIWYSRNCCIRFFLLTN